MMTIAPMPLAATDILDTPASAPRTADLIESYAAPVPRYTSYPTAPHFHEGVDSATYAGWLQALPADAALSLYLHIPFCDRLCWFCGCHTKQTRQYAPIAAYLGALRRETEAIAGLVTGGRVTAIHFGGGSPSMLVPDDFRALMALIRDRYGVAPDAEISLEIDPGDMDETRFDAFADAGLTRASLGVQDFDPRVQEAINRPQSFADTKAVVDGVRKRGVRSVNIDILYGLPLQTVPSVLDTVAQVISLAPDRIALFGYAHVPWMKKHQTMIAEDVLPGRHARFAQAEAAAEALVAAGYERIGLDHFALPADGLAAADREGKLHRNFQGYTVDNADALIGLGASAIGQLPQGYVQNVVATGLYQQRVAADGLAIAKGIALSNEDRVRAYAIERLMCDFALDYDDLRSRFGDYARPVIRNLKLVASLEPAGMTEASVTGFAVTREGRPFVRSIAARLDAYLGRGTARHSAAV